MGTWKQWLKGLAAASLQAIGSAGSLYLVDNKDFNFSHAGLILLGKAIGASILVAVFLYLQHPPKE